MRLINLSIPLGLALLFCAGCSWIGGCSTNDTRTGKAGTAGDTQPFEATAYSIEGETASGQQTREGIVAADPDILPLGSRIRVHDAGEYSGEYTVADTGRAINGREIDIYLRSDREAKDFGRRTVQVEVIELAAKD